MRKQYETAFRCLITGTILTVLLSGRPGRAVAQGQPERSPFGQGITVSYFGEVATHPGAVIGAEQNLLASPYQLVIGVNLGGYFHKRNHTGVFANLQIGQRYRFRSGFYVEQYVGLGYLRSYLNGDRVHQGEDNSIISQRGNSGRGYRMPLVSVGAGWNVAQGRNSKPLLLFVRPTLFWQASNSYLLKHIALQTGITKIMN